MRPEDEIAHVWNWRERCIREMKRMRFKYTFIALLLYVVGCATGVTYEHWKAERADYAFRAHYFKNPKQIQGTKSVNPCDMEYDQWLAEHGQLKSR